MASRLKVGTSSSGWEILRWSTANAQLFIVDEAKSICYCLRLNAVESVIITRTQRPMPFNENLIESSLNARWDCKWRSLVIFIVIGINGRNVVRFTKTCLPNGLAKTCMFFAQPIICTAKSKQMAINWINNDSSRKCKIKIRHRNWTNVEAMIPINFQTVHLRFALKRKWQLLTARFSFSVSPKKQHT